MKNLIKSTVIGVMLIAGFTLNISCTNNSDDSNEKAVYTSSIEDYRIGYQSFETKCNSCHHNTDNAAAMLAPPFINIKSKYKAVYKTKETFVQAIVDFNQNPSTEKALMRGALKKFEVMPKLKYSEDELNEIALYIYGNNFKKPKWFIY